MNHSDFVGLAGVACYLAAYALLQLGRLTVASGRYAALNAAGSLLILYSLAFSFNLPSFITQTLWLLLTGIGYFRSRRDEPSLG